MNIIQTTKPELKLHTACFSGGRPKSLYPVNAYAGYRNADYDILISNVTDLLEELYQRGITRFISGGAQGFDQLAFHAVKELQSRHSYQPSGSCIENIVYIPFWGQEGRWSEYGRFGQKDYRAMLEQATAVYCCTDTVDPKLAAYPVITKALFHRNECMCNDSSICVGQFPDNSWTSYTTKGGTAGCLRYAKNLGMELIVKDFRP